MIVGSRQSLKTKIKLLLIETTTAPTTTPDTQPLTTFTFTGPVTVKNTASESGECQIRISVLGRVTMNCECTGKLSNKEVPGTLSRIGEARHILPTGISKTMGYSAAVTLILSLAAIVIAGGILAAYFVFSEQDDKCSLWLTRLQNQILGLIVMSQVNDGPSSQTQSQIDRTNSMAAQYSTEISRFNNECGMKR